MTTEEMHQRFNLLAGSGLPTPELEELLLGIQQQLADGALQVAEPVPGAEPDLPGRWKVVPWVKRALMLAAQLSSRIAQPTPWSGTELELAPWRRGHTGSGLIPFGCHLRGSAFVAETAALTPTAVVQAGAHVGNFCLLDAHVLVGNCAYVGDRVVLQAGAIVAGHLLPERALPNILEDDCRLGGGSGLYDGVVLGRGSILLPGTVISAQTGVFDLSTKNWHRPDGLGNLWLAPGMVVGMGSGPVGPAGPGMQRTFPMIVGRRDLVEDTIGWYDQESAAL